MRAMVLNHSQGFVQNETFVLNKRGHNNTMDLKNY
jgi:hypothetical protein